MRIDVIEVYLARMSLTSPWRAGHGDEAAIESVFVKIVSGKLACGVNLPRSPPPRTALSGHRGCFLW